MTDITLLAYIPDPFAVQQSRFMVCSRGTDPHSISATELAGYPSRIMTYDVQAIVDDLRRLRQQPPKNILDIGDALRLLVARSKDDGGDKQWNVWPVLKRYFSSTSDANVFEETVESRIDRPQPAEQVRLLKEALNALRLLWKDISTQLQAAGEIDRLISVEWPLQSIFAYRQFAGIRVDSENACKLLDVILSEKYVAYRDVAAVLNKSPTGLTFWNVHPYLDRTDVSHLASVSPGGRLQDAFELAAPYSPFALSFLSLVKARRDESIVKRAIGGTERVYPLFHVLGTVSGRILVSDPYLQQLRRAYRSLVAPDPHARLVYLDYAQFEPGVLAGLAEDERLIKAYNAGDVYTALAEALFGDPTARPIAKRVFLAFSYGMSPERISAILTGGGKSLADRKAYEVKINAFFKEFSKLEGYRTSQQEQLLANGSVASLLGNRRLRTNQGVLSGKERRWSLNHPVQATASLIFKEALISIVQEFGMESIILPMHDAALLQLSDDDSFNYKVAGASELMIAAYNRRLPNIRARVTVGSFDQRN